MTNGRYVIETEPLSRGFGARRVVDGFERGLPAARVVRIPHANHYIFQSNEAAVLREINAFVRSIARR